MVALVARRARLPGASSTTDCPNPRKRPHSLSDITASAPDDTPFGTFDDEGNYLPRQIVEDDLGQSFEDAIAGTLVDVEDGQIVNGTVVKIDKDEVLLDIGYKSEGVIPSRELSIRNDVNPFDVVKMGEELEALVLTKEDKEGRLLLSKKRAQYERAWGTIEKIKKSEGIVEGPVIEVVKGGLIMDIGLRGSRPPRSSSCAGCATSSPTWAGCCRPRSSSSTRTATTSCCPAAATWKRPRRSSGRTSWPTSSRATSAPVWCRRSWSFGAFVDLGGMDGLIHVSELSWKHVDHPGPRSCRWATR